ncbi:Transcription factor 7-like 1-A HMG box transcription factor 3-A [Takifugu flavidus]|uniref:Transcription factor 7-like 1-A HMG box transcription factor 3-A n=1 Tax=Takifugu flavidus TaxID=433684 RepID=A0A5C6N249_9TELE|nr:Transcription factor 7-like 1-A HMG box transcription factor 3-A [Takifugu flavidus]
MRSCEEQEDAFFSLISNFTSLPQYLQMKWPLLDVPGSAGLKDSRSPTPGHLGPLVLTGSPADYVLITPAEERMHKVGGNSGLAPQAPTLH